MRLLYCYSMICLYVILVLQSYRNMVLQHRSAMVFWYGSILESGLSCYSIIVFS